MRKYRLVAKKGEGTFSEVLKAQNVKDGRYHAIKCMKNRFDSIDQVNNLREIQALRRLSPHEHIITLEEVLYDQPTGRLALVFELMDANLYELIRGRRHYLNPNLIKSYMWQLMKSLDHMHKKGIFHRDIKPENILIESVNEIGKGLKLADFGSCRGIYSKQPYTEYISTRWYRAPECLLTDGYYGPEMDLWGAGCVMFEITSLYPLFPGSNEVDQINRIHKVLGTPSAEALAKFKSKGASHINFDFPPQKGIGIPQLLPHASPDAIDLMIKLLKYDAAERITAREAMRHPYFKEVRESEAKTQSEAKVLAQANTMPPSGITPSSQMTVGASSVANSTTGATASVAGAAPSAKPLPTLVPAPAQAGTDPTIGAKANASDNSSVATGIGSSVAGGNYHLMGKGSQAAGNKAVANGNGNGSNANAAANTGSSLPPIKYMEKSGGGGGNTGMLGSGVKGNNMTANSNASAASNSQTKKRKKYRMNYAQQQNSEGVMKAYGVPKIFGSSNEMGNGGGGGGLLGGLGGTKMGTGMSANAGFSGGGTYGQYPSYGGGGKKY